jgi:uncharacterized coiled-coil DUF342 family protein
LQSLAQHITQLTQKLQLLVKQFDTLRKDNIRQETAIRQLKEEKSRLEAEIELLRQQNLVLKSGVAPLEGSDRKEMEKKIDGYIKHIDTCITLLSQ